MNKNILIVDDDKRLRELLKDYLIEKNLKIFQSEDYNEAKEILSLVLFDLIILDRMMPSGDGIELIDHIRKILPDCGISHDMISGFPNETEEDHQATLSLMEYVKYDFGFMFMYSERPGTPAAKKLDDNIPDDVKKHRLKEVVALQQQHGLYRTQQFVGQIVEVLIEKESKKSKKHWSGRNQQNTVVVFPKENFKVGDFVNVKIEDCTSATLIGKAV